MAKGEAILEEVYQEDPNDPGVNNDLGYLYADQGKKLEQAEKMIRIAVEAEGDNPVIPGQPRLGALQARTSGRGP
ncbi:MAG UNVERIFIED_CONTAM: tetratricopeptide repeat protein [Planctomycetaceae bacterium]